MHDLARGGSERPLIQSVGGGLEGHAEDDEAQISDGQVEDEQVGGLGVHLPAAEQDEQDEGVPHGAEQEDEREAGGDER